MAGKQTRDDDFLAKVRPRIRAGAPPTLLETADKLRFAIWVNARTDITLRVIAAAVRPEPPGLVDKAFHVLVLELQDAAVTKLDALYDTNPARVSIPAIVAAIKKDRVWLDQGRLACDMLLQQVDELLSLEETAATRKRIGRWRNDEAGHIAWTTDRFSDGIYVDLVSLQDTTSKIPRDLAQVAFAVDIERSFPYRESLAQAMGDQLLRGRQGLA